MHHWPGLSQANLHTGPPLWPHLSHTPSHLQQLHATHFWLSRLQAMHKLSSPPGTPHLPAKLPQRSPGRPVPLSPYAHTKTWANSFTGKCPPPSAPRMPLWLLLGVPSGQHSGLAHLRLPSIYNEITGLHSAGTALWFLNPVFHLITFVLFTWVANSASLMRKKEMRQDELKSISSS